MEGTIQATAPLPEPRAVHRVPDHPLVVIGPPTGWMGLNLRDLWAYRDLLYFLAWRDVKVRYKQTVLGAAWAVIQPMFMMLIFTLFFGKLANMPATGVPYPIFVYAGLLPWTYFQNAVTSSGNSLVGNSNLISKVYFPRLLVPAAAVVAGLVDFFIAWGILVVLMWYFEISLNWGMLMLPVLVVLTTLYALGMGMWMSALTVKFRDIRYALPFFLQFLMFATPVIYPSSIVPVEWRWVLQLNPMTGIIGGYRSAILGRPLDWASLGISTALTLALLTYALFAFRRMEAEFADII